MSSVPENLIIRSIQKTATPEEEAQLYKWLLEDKKNVELYSQLDEIWSTKNSLSEQTIRDGWYSFQQKMESRNREIPGSKLRHAIPWLQYVAAVFLGIIISGITFYIVLNQRDPIPEIVVQQVVYNKNGTQQILLPDHSEVWLNDNSRLTYPEVFSNQKRIVNLEGKAFFDVKKNIEQPFIVQTGEIEIEVTGTEFEIGSFDETTLLVTLISGGVNILAKDYTGNVSTTSLQPGQQAEVNKENSRIIVHEINTELYLAWKDGTYRFKDEPLERIVPFIAHHFNMDIQISASLKKKRFTGRVTPANTIEDVMLMFAKSHPVKYKRKENTLLISEP